MIDFQNVCKLLGGRDVFNNASFRINKGERVGVVGPNGAGKTTLFNMVVGEMSPDKGDVIVPEKARIGLLRQQLGFFKEEQSVLSYVEAASGELPAIEARMKELEAQLAKTPGDQSMLTELGRLQSSFEQMGGYEMTHRAETALAGLGFPQDVFQKPMGSFSGGWQMRACMARVLLGEPDILLLDEPSNYLDIPAVEWLQRRLKTYAGTLLLISHDRFLLNSLTDVTLEINGGKTTRYPGNYSCYVRDREARRIQAESERHNLERRRQQLQDNINRFRAKATKAAQVQSWIKMLDKMEDVELPEDLHFQGQIRIPEPPRCGVEVINLTNVSHTYDGTRWIFRDVNLSVANGDKIGIIGYNGQGKTTLLKIIAGRFAPTEGARILGHKVVVGYQAQEFAELLPAEQTAYDVVKQAAQGNDSALNHVREILGAFGFSGESALKQCKVLSGGEKIRLCFARIFVNPPNLLILDEPTTHLDIAAREALQDALKKYTGTVCMVSHDLEFVRGTATNILEMREHHVRRFSGDYDYYKEKTAAEEAAAAGIAARTIKTASAEPDSVNQKERRKEKAARRNEMAPEKRRLEKEVARLEKKIDDAEKEKTVIMEELSKPGDNVDYAGLQKRLKNLDYDISEATIAWEEAAGALEEFMKEYDAI